MTSVVEVGTMKTAAPENKLSRTLKVAAIGAVVGMAVTIGIAYPVLDDKWNAPAASPAPLACSAAQPQSPRDVSNGAPGSLTPRVAVHDEAPTNYKHVNTHYHLGAEHKSDEYNTQHDTSGAGTTLLPTQVEYGFYCDNVPLVTGLSTAQKTDYDWLYCRNTRVDRTYEMHWVYSSGGEGVLSAGLGGAFDTQNNPSVTVRAQVYHIVNDNSGVYDRDDHLEGWNATAAAADSVTYSGSTTGRLFNNDDSCSPFQVTWQVDRKCHLISAKSFDAMCEKMRMRYDIEADAQPHPSRDVIIPALSSSTVMTLTSTGTAAV